MNTNMNYYIGPGMDLVFQSSGAVLGFVISLLALLGAYIIGIFNFFKKKKTWLIAGILVITALLIINMGKNEGNDMRIIVLGMDGLSPDIVESLIAEGKLPNFASLKARGTFAKLGTTVPPQSPVAWATFATGCNPGKHGIFDFLVRNPETYMPDLVLSRSEKPKFVTIGSMKIPLSRSKVTSPIGGEPFWRITSRNKIPTIVLRHPLTFPPEKICGRMISGLGTPDIQGTQGTFSFYTSSRFERPEAGGRVIEVSAGNRIDTYIQGPRDTVSGGDDISLPMHIEVSKETESVRLSIKDQHYDLNTASWSPWIRVEFSINRTTKVNGIVRFYLKSVSPEFGLYMSPVNFDPEHPAFPVSYPGSFSKELAKDIGLYHTLGQSGDTWMLNENRVSEAAALEQYYQVLGEDEKILMHELGRFENGVFFFYFGITDTIQHMFYSGHAGGRDNPVHDIYMRMDKVLGRVMENAGKETVLIVMSDHGFGPYGRAVHLNTWLKENGYLCLQHGYSDSPEFFENIDWTRTKAYSVGLSGMYVNLKGRESKGIVAPGEEAENLKREIAAKLVAAEDAGKRMVRNIYFKENVYKGKYIGDSPDIIVGLEPGWRFSWQTALGGVPARVLEDNTKHWNGDHIFDAAAMPGVLFMNRKINTANPGITDIAPTILKLLNITIPEEMDGKPLVDND